MPSKVDAMAQLVAESRDLEELGARVQGETELTASPHELAELVARYQDWLGRALSLLPDEYHERFRNEYDGSWISHKIKHFLLNPAEVSVMHRGDDGTGENPFPYWQYPFDTTFRGPLLAQRLVLTEAQQLIRAAGPGEDLLLVERICRGFGEFLVPLASRQRGRPPMVVEDEYDVQDLLQALLRVFFDDVRSEDFSPERAGARSRPDFVLKTQRIVVEAKMTRPGLGAKAIGDQLILDIERYRAHPDCDALVALVYDPDRIITNPRTLQSDLSADRDGMLVRVVVVN
jgi:REase_DpnII-MboI